VQQTAAPISGIAPIWKRPMKVTDEDTGKPFFLDVTAALSDDLEIWRNAACGHPAVEVRKRRDGGGAVHFFRQCTSCGTSVGTALKKSTELDSAAAWDKKLESRTQKQREADRLSLVQKHVRIQRTGAEGFKREYDVYLKSPEWARRRATVLRRAGGICEGCLGRKATQVHHLTYDHIYNEFMFELVAVCDECHKRLHSEKTGDHEPEPENERRDGFPCDACRWQHEYKHRRWCSILDIYAADALAEGGDCGPTQKMLEPLK
jgi:hypothetical protein